MLAWHTLQLNQDEINAFTNKFDHKMKRMFETFILKVV